jgi:HSP20 family molecular chaperone IbpA
MTEKSFSFDMGKIMDEAFRFAENIGENIGNAFPHDVFEKMRNCGRGPFGAPDFYPGYMYPPANVYLTPEKKLVFEIALAGFTEKDISIQYKGDSLVFSAKAPPAGEPDPNVQFFKRRLKLKDIEEQRFYVPADKFNQSGTQATFKNGLLKIVVPPRDQADKGPEIKVDIHVEGRS